MDICRRSKQLLGGWPIIWRARQTQIKWVSRRGLAALCPVLLPRRRVDDGQDPGLHRSRLLGWSTPARRTRSPRAPGSPAWSPHKPAPSPAKPHTASDALAHMPANPFAPKCLERSRRSSPCARRTTTCRAGRLPIRSRPAAAADAVTGAGQRGAPAADAIIRPSRMITVETLARRLRRPVAAARAAIDGAAADLAAHGGRSPAYAAARADAPRRRCRHTSDGAAPPPPMPERPPEAADRPRPGRLPQKQRDRSRPAPSARRADEVDSYDSDDDEREEFAPRPRGMG